MKRVALYLRVSTTEQTVANQRWSWKRSRRGINGGWLPPSPTRA